MVDSQTISYQVTEDHAEARLDRFLADVLPDYSRTYFRGLIEDGLVKCDKVVCTVPKKKLCKGETVSVELREVVVAEKLFPENIPLQTIYEDESLLVINKPAGLVVHPASGNPTGTIVNALLGRDANFAKKLADDEEEARKRPGIVHRLDKDTSGCLVVAKNSSTRFKLAKLFASREVTKIYAAIVLGKLQEPQGEIRTLIGRHPVNRKKMAVVDRNGKEAVTKFKVLKDWTIENISVSLLRVRIMTGRTHQIRVHLAHHKNPVLGDKVYGGNQRLAVPRQMLHAWKLGFPHPVTGKVMTFKSPFPEDFEEVLEED